MDKPKTRLIKKHAHFADYQDWFRFQFDRLNYDLERFVEDTGYPKQRVHRWLSDGPQEWEVHAIAASFVVAERTGKSRKFLDLQRSPHGKSPRLADLTAERMRRELRAHKDKARFLKEGNFVNRDPDTSQFARKQLRRIGADLIERQQLEIWEGFEERVLQILPSSEVFPTEKGGSQT